MTQNKGIKNNENKLIAQDKKQSPIGLFDSGVGGLSVYLHLRRKLAYERYIYYADTLNVPYGSRTSADIAQLTMQAVDWLVEAGCKLIVIACNTASAHGLIQARKAYPHVPIVGLVPALKPAVLATKSNKVAVLATRATLDGKLLNDVITQYADPYHIAVDKWFDASLVPWVEAGMVANVTADQLRQQLHALSKQSVDYLVLGCTHYPFFRDFLIEEITNSNLGITVIDSGAAIADRVYELLSQHQCLTTHPNFDLFQPRVECSFLLPHKADSIQSMCFLETDAVELPVIKSVNNQTSVDNNKAVLQFFSTDYRKDLATLTGTVKRLIASAS